MKYVFVLIALLYSCKTTEVSDPYASPNAIPKESYLKMKQKGEAKCERYFEEFQHADNCNKVILMRNYTNSPDAGSLNCLLKMAMEFESLSGIKPSTIADWGGYRYNEDSLEHDCDKWESYFGCK